MKRSEWFLLSIPALIFALTLILAGCIPRDGMMSGKAQRVCVVTQVKDGVVSRVDLCAGIP